jgi:tetratricopeptide (TPR) repeat protein
MSGSNNTRTGACQLSQLPASRNARSRARGQQRPHAYRLLAAALTLALAAAACSGDVESRMAEVRVLQDVGQFTASIDELREILAIAPDLPEANYRLGIALHQTGNPSRAVWALQKASESQEYQIQATLLLASVQFNLNNYEESIRATNRVLEIDPNRQVALQIRSKGNLAIHALDEALADTTRLIELAPDDYPVRVVHATVLAEMGRVEEAEAAQFLVKKMSEASGDPQTASRGCLAPALFAREDLKDLERAESLYEDCAAKYPSDAFVIPHIVTFFDSIEKSERGTELIRKAVEEAPESLSLRSTLASRLSGQGEPDEAESVLREAVDSFGSASAWSLLVSHYRQTKQSEKALEAIEKVLDLTGGGGDQARFMHADLLIDVGDLERAEEVAGELEEPTYATMIYGRISLVNGDAAGALAAFDEGIANWPNNAGARYLAGAAALRLGDFERAIVEFRESVRVDSKATSAARTLARLYFERGDYAQAINFSSISIQGQGPEQRGEDLRLAARALAAMGEFDKARVATQTLSDLPGQRASAAAELAIVERLASGPAAAVSAVEGAGLDLTDPANELALRALAQHLELQDKRPAAIARVEQATTANPDSASLQSLLGVVLAGAGRDADARAAFDRSIAIDPKRAEALGGLGTLSGRTGDAAQAIELLDRATEIDSESETYPYSAAKLALGMGARDDALARLRRVVRDFPGHAAARNDLAWMLAEDGKRSRNDEERKTDLDLALQLAEEASRLDPAPEILDTLGYVHIQRGESSAAVAVLEKAVAANASSPSIRYRLGTAFNQAGDTERAREMLSGALEAGPFPEAEQARRELAQLDQR